MDVINGEALSGAAGSMRRVAVERRRSRRLAVLGRRFSDGVPMPTTLLMRDAEAYFARRQVATTPLEARAPHPSIGAALVSLPNGRLHIRIPERVERPRPSSPPASRSPPPRS